MNGNGPVLLHDRNAVFPNPELATPDGLLAVGGDLEPERLLAAYRAGIFPWPLLGADGPLLWFSPDPRLVLRPDRLRLSRSLRKELRRGRFETALDTRFRDVVCACAEDRPGQQGTWITPPLIDAFERLHRLGHAHSVECLAGGELVGGLYGLAIGGAFFGESMFARRSNASKVALVRLVDHLRSWGYAFVDCQQATEHLLRLGAEQVPRPRFLSELAAAVELTGCPGSWRDCERLAP